MSRSIPSNSLFPFIFLYIHLCRSSKPMDLMWWNDIRANISFLRPEESIKLKNLPITTSELRSQFYAQDKQVEFEDELVAKCGFTKDLAQRIATCMWKALQGDAYFIETLQKEKETRKGLIVVGEVSS